MFGLSSYELYAILQLVYGGVVLCAVAVLVVSPLVELGFSRWIPTTHPLPTTPSLWIRAITLANLFLPTLLFPALHSPAVSATPPVKGAEFFTLLLVGGALSLVVKTFISKGFALLPRLMKNVAKNVPQRSGPKPFNLSSIFVFCGLNSAFIFVCLYFFRLSTRNTSDWLTLAQAFENVMRSEPITKAQLLAMVELPSLLILSGLIVVFMMFPLASIKYANGLQAQTLQAQAPITLRTIKILLSVSVLSTALLSFFLPL
ncbi:hypothetical protein [Magnetovibrio blakemorei]|uniref:hypothetical protein n=1 Tax=Magnetovibrio blakemorei TaxID=28181 RepID=UPI001113021E|nr:hypothetical protein [Magnetovibrio blakemorei]